MLNKVEAGWWGLRAEEEAGADASQLELRHASAVALRSVSGGEQVLYA